MVRNKKAAAGNESRGEAHNEYGNPASHGLSRNNANQWQAPRQNHRDMGGQPDTRFSSASVRVCVTHSLNTRPEKRGDGSKAQSTASILPLDHRATTTPRPTDTLVP
jgi:hypothetical protein